MQLEITVLNWEKYNPKRDQKTYTWFKLQNTFPFSVSMEQLDFKRKWMVICLLCEASRHNKGTFTTSIAILSRISNIEKSEILAILNDIEKTSIISTMSLTRQDDVVNTSLNKNRIDKNKEEKISLELSNLPHEINQDPVLMEFLTKANIKSSSLLLWIKTYQDVSWLKLEFLKMLSWLDANPQKKPKSNYARFMSSWLSRAWEYHRKNLPSNKALPRTEEVDIWKQS